MRCPNCQRESAENAVFCNHCGTQLRNICSSCNTLNPLDSNFCSRCGLSSSFELQETEAPAHRESQRSSSVQSMACPRCHKVNETGSTYCYSCGLPLDEIADSPQPSAMQQPRYRPYTQSEAQHPSQAYDGRQAGFWVRLGAYVIDFIFVFVLFLIPLTIAAAFAEFSPESWLAKSFESYGEEYSPLIEWFDVVGYIAGLFYFTIGVAAWSTTIGKRVCGAYVLRSDGSRVGFVRAALRYLCYFVSASTLGIGFLMIAFRGDKRGLHDLICDTMVVRR